MKQFIYFMVWSGAALPVAAQLVHVEVFRSGEDGYHTYRIPAIVRTTKGTLLAFCEGRKHSARDWGDIDILLKRSRDGGRTWSPAIRVADFGEDTVGNPAPVEDRKSGTVWLLLTRNPGDVPEKNILPGWEGPTRTVWLTWSKDDGLSWAPPVEITRSVKRPEWSWYATGPVNGIQLRSGRLLIPCDHVVRADLAQRYSHVIYSDDGGRSWQIGGSVGPDCNESTVAELSDGTLMLNMRSYGGRNRRAVALSRDGGLSWSPPAFDETLVEPDRNGQGQAPRAAVLQSGFDPAREHDRQAEPRRRQVVGRLPDGVRRPFGLFQPGRDRARRGGPALRARRKRPL